PLTSSAQTAHGTVGGPEVIVPAATRGSSASPPESLFSVHLSSALAFFRHGPALFGPEVSRIWGALVFLPTASHTKPPSTVPCVSGGGTTAFAANTRSLVTPNLPLLISYQTAHGTASLVPVKAMSGSIPSRVGSTLSYGSTRLAIDERSTPTCCQQKPASGAPTAGFVPG